MKAKINKQAVFTFAKVVALLVIVRFIYKNLKMWVVDGEACISGFFVVLIIGVAVSLLVLGMLEKIKIINRNTRINLILLMSSVLIAATACEFYVRHYSKYLMSYGERNGSECYGSAYKTWLNQCPSCNNGSFFINGPYSDYFFDKPEFKYHHKYNSYGLRDKEFTVAKAPNEFRIMGIGDSFTEGVGTLADSTWLKQLEYRLNGSDTTHQYTTMNAGAHGSDIFFEYDLLTKCLLKYHPDLLILDLNSTDYNDIICRGAYERYDKDGNFVNKKGPWWEYLYGSSYLVRLVSMKGFHYNWQLLTPEQHKQEEDRILKAMSKKLDEFQTLADKNHFKFLLVLQPLQEELTDSTHELDKLKISPTIRQIDLTPTYETEVDSLHIPLKQLYYPSDGHYTTFGYSIMANAIYKNYFKQTQ